MYKLLRSFVIIIKSRISVSRDRNCAVLSCKDLGVGLDDLQRSLSILMIVRFCGLSAAFRGLISLYLNPRR